MIDSAPALPPATPYLIGLTAFALGCVHALEPGHGKSMIATFVIGQSSRWPQLLLLALTVTLAHVLSVTGLALLGVLLVSQAVPAQAGVTVLPILSGLLVLTLGVVLLWRQRRGELTSADTCCDGPVHHHHRPEEDLAEPTGHAAPETRTSLSKTPWGSVVTLGVASGLTPCPVALSALTLSFANSGWHHWPRALGVLVIFSLGLGMTLACIGLCGSVLARTVQTSSFWQRGGQQWGRWLGFVSAVLMIGLGLGLTVQAVLHPPDLTHPDPAETTHWQHWLDH